MKKITAIRTFAIAAIITISGATFAEEEVQGKEAEIIKMCQEQAQAEAAENAEAFIQECIKAAKDEMES